MESNYKIIITVFIAIIISFFLLFIMIESTNENQLSIGTNNLSENTAEYFSKLTKLNDQKIYLLGSSQIGRFNETFIQHYLKNNNQDFKVFNLAISADTPEKRLNSIDLIIKTRPSIIVYGIGYRDFTELNFIPIIDKPNTILPDPEKISNTFYNTISEQINYDLEKFNSPKSLTVQFLKLIIDQKEEKTSPITRLNAPFYQIDKSNTVILNNFELKRSMSSFPYKLDTIKPIKDNEYVESLKSIISKILEQKIELIIITIPYSQYYLDTIPEKDKREFDNIIQDLEHDFNLQVTLFHYKYANHTIWNSNDHIAYGGKEISPNEDTSKIILDILEN